MALSPSPEVTNVVSSQARAGEVYDAAVGDLERVLAEGKDQLDPKTLKVIEDNLRIIDRAIAEARSAIASDPANAYLRSQLEERYQFEGIIGRSRAMQPLFSMLETVARTASTVLVTGETGTGKEVIAKAIHHNSPRKAHRFVAVNCAALPETLL